MRPRFRLPSPAVAISLVALFVALGGTSYAAFSLPANSVGSKQLKKNAVITKKIKNHAVTAAKINPAGLTVPNATNANHANSANTANTANSAIIGDSPVAWAEVRADGTVAAGRGITSANITNLSAAYCFHGLTFPFKSMMATGDYGLSVVSDLTAAVAVPSNPSDCGTNPAEVATSQGGGFTAEPFFVYFYN